MLYNNLRRPVAELVADCRGGFRTQTGFERSTILSFRNIRVSGRSSAAAPAARKDWPVGATLWRA
jgi:hypothetical protein